MLSVGNQIHNFISSSGSGTVINYGSGSGSDFLTSYGSGSTRQKVTVPTVPTVPVPVPVPVPIHNTDKNMRILPIRIPNTKLYFWLKWRRIRIGRSWMRIQKNGDDPSGSGSIGLVRSKSKILTVEGRISDCISISSRRWVRTSFWWMAMRSSWFSVFFSSSAPATCRCNKNDSIRKQTSKEN
jgi:hypothetical protein